VTGGAAVPQSVGVLFGSLAEGKLDGWSRSD